jgi:hypothetical protein
MLGDRLHLQRVDPARRDLGVGRPDRRSLTAPSSREAMAATGPRRDHTRHLEFNPLS